MKLAAVSGHAYPLFGGAQLTVWTLLQRLHAEYGFECALYTPYAVKHHWRKGAVPCATYRDADELKQMVRAAQPDVLLAALEAAPDALWVAAHFQIPSLVYHQSFEYYRLTAFEKKRWHLNPARAYPSAAEVDYVLCSADLQLTNSRDMQARFAHKYGLRTRVLYPEFDRDALSTQHHPHYITGICGMPYKGADIFLALADAFPQEPFLLVGEVHPDYRIRLQQRANITVRGRDESKHFLSESKVVLVPSQWAEPFGRIAVEALGAGIPTLVSFTGGLKEIVGTAPFGVRKFRAVAEWRSKLAALLASDELRAAYGAQGRKTVSRFLKGSSTQKLAGWVTELAARKKPQYDAAPLVILRGAQTSKTAFAMVNGALYEQLARHPQIRMRAAESEDALAFQLPDVVIDSDFAQNFGELAPPKHGKWVVMRTWDFGPFPERWVAKINKECDQLWVHSRWVRAQAIAGGVEPRRVRVLPLGIDPHIYKPQGAVYPLATKKHFKFLFVGATVLRKGIDLLLDAYGKTFTRADDVCLVIKDHGDDVFYKGISYRDEIAKWQRKPDAPEILYLNSYLSAHEMGALYRACDVGVFPYRAEGFGMPILEAMACGTPPIVPKFGACLDFCTPSTAFLMPVRRIRLPVQGEFAINTLGFTEELQQVDFCQARVETLSEFLVKAYRLPKARLQQKAHTGTACALSSFTWQHSAAQGLRHLAALERLDTPYRLRQLREQKAVQCKKLEVAQQLYQSYLDSQAR